MARQAKGKIINGWINLNKPAGLSSTQAIGKVRRILQPRKIGHAGTLDPLATGVLPLALGEATKTIPYCQDHLKTYSFDILWGEFRDTDDAEGQIIDRSDYRPCELEITKILPQFTGQIEQTPPQFSAIKVAGQRAYDRARKGLETNLMARTVDIKSLELTHFDKNRISLLCICGKGTYMRSLARDISRALNTAGYIDKLRRDAVGPLILENSISLANLKEMADSADLKGVLLPTETVLDDIPALALSEKEALRLRNGQKLSFIARSDFQRLEQAGINIRAPNKVLTLFDGKPLAIVMIEGPQIKPIRLFNL